MNDLAHIVCTSLLTPVLVISCMSQTSGPRFPDAQDPLEFAKQFENVCKVGKKGGDGTLIDKNWVLTAGHVAEGMFGRSGGDLHVYFDNGSVYSVKHVFVHPEYKPMGKFDIALLELKLAVPDIETTALNTSEDEQGEMIYLVGHGDKRFPDGTWVKDGKLRAYTNIIDEVSETNILFDYDGPEEEPTVNEGTSGPGDSGGPAFIKSSEGYLIAGVSSMGEPGRDGPCSYGAVEHFVRVSKFNEWLVGTMKDPNPNLALNSEDLERQNEEQGMVVEFELGQGKEALGESAEERLAQIIVDGLRSGSLDELEKAIDATFDSEVLKNRSAEQMIDNMPALVQNLCGAKLANVNSVSQKKVSMTMVNNGSEFILDLFFLDSGKIDQMAFGKLD